MKTVCIGAERYNKSVEPSTESRNMPHLEDAWYVSDIQSQINWELDQGNLTMVVS